MLALSHTILSELETVFQGPYFRQRLGPTEIAASLALLRTHALIVPVPPAVEEVATHPEDDLILASAVSARADYLGTGDAQLRQIRTYRGVRIVSPREFLNALGSGEDRTI